MENSNSSGVQLEMNFNIPSGNRFRRCLENGVFTVLFEVTPPGRELQDSEAAQRLEKLEKLLLGCSTMPCALAITDHCWSDSSRSALEYAALLPEKNRNSHLFYLSGRNRSFETVQGLLAEAAGMNLENFAAVSGDRRSGENAQDLRKISFAESTGILRDIQQYTNKKFFPGATVNAHSYSAPNLYSSLCKLVKKFNLGAEFAVTQAGFDMAQLDALRRYLSWRGYHQGLIARLLFLTPEKVEKITAGMLPGINISDDFLAILNKELRFSSSQFEAAQYRRLELQAAGCKLLGYSGIQIYGIDTPEKISIAMDRISRAIREFTSLLQWLEEYKFYMARSDMAPADEAFYLYEELLKTTSPTAQTGSLTEFKLPQLSWVQRQREAACRFFFPDAAEQDPGERQWLKKLLTGCRSCQQCRLPQTQFYCVERCPKGLTNGPCGSVLDNGNCDAGNFPCVHLQIWHAAQKHNQCDTLENGYIESAND